MNGYSGVKNRGGSSVLITKNPFDFIWWMIIGEPPVILREVYQCHKKENPWLQL